MSAFKEQIIGAARRGRLRLASALVTLGVRLHVALADLGFVIAPALFGRDDGRRPTPWLGLAVLALLVIGAATVGYAGIVGFRQVAPQREAAP